MDCGGGAEPSVRPGWEKGSLSLEGLPHRLPIVARGRGRLASGCIYQQWDHALYLIFGVDHKQSERHIAMDIVLDRCWMSTSVKAYECVCEPLVDVFPMILKWKVSRTAPCGNGPPSCVA